MRTKIVYFSDTHGLHRQVSIPESDILIHAGDLTSLDKGLNSIREFENGLVNFRIAIKSSFPATTILLSKSIRSRNRCFKTRPY